MRRIVGISTVVGRDRPDRDITAIAASYPSAMQRRLRPASVQGLAADSPALRGGSTMVELGYRFIPPDSRLSWHIHMAGWQGTRRGMTGNIQVSWAF